MSCLSTLIHIVHLGRWFLLLAFLLFYFLLPPDVMFSFSADISASSLLLPVTITIPAVIVFFIAFLSMRHCCKKFLRKVKREVWPPVPKPNVLIRLSVINGSQTSMFPDAGGNFQEEVTMLSRRRYT